MEDDIDIYEDLPNLDVKSNKTLNASTDQENNRHERVELEKQVAELTVKLQDYQKVNETLETNLLSLLKTAKAEIARKDRMIADLRKKLDDSTFKRGVYAKQNEYIVHKSSAQENSYYNSADSSSSSTEHKFLTAEADPPLYNTNKDQRSKSTLTPITIFGERLRKRIADEQNLENKDKQLIEFNICENNDKYIEGYAVESDKENGSARGTNSCDSKEVHASTISQYSESEPAKVPAMMSKVTTKDFLAPKLDKDVGDTKSQEKSMHNVKWTGKRGLEETDRSIPAKRIKSTEELPHDGTAKKKLQDGVLVESVQEKSFMKHNELKPLDNLSKRLKDTFKNSGVDRSRDLNVDTRERTDRIFLRKYKTHQGKDTKDENDDSCEKRASEKKGHFLKRHDHGTTGENSMSVWDERNATHRSIEVFDKGEERRINVNKRYRTRQREDRYPAIIDDHRSRGRAHSVHGKGREDKYNRSKYHINSKYTSHGARCDKRYDDQSSVDRSRNRSNCIDRESSNEPRATVDRTKRPTTIDRRPTNGETSDHYDEYESRKSKTIDRSTKGEKKRNECNAYPYKESNNGKLTERSRYSKVSRSRNSSERKNDCLLERVDQKEQRKPEIASKIYNNESEKSRDPVDESHVDRQLEDGKIGSSSTSNPSKSNSEQKDLCKESDSDNAKDVAIFMKKSKIVSGDVSQCLPAVSNAQVASLGKRHLDTNENVENVENIEKFIRDYVPNEQNIGETFVSGEKVSTDTNVIFESDCKSEPCMPDTELDYICSHEGGKGTRKKDVERTASENTFPCDSKGSVENGQLKTKTKTETVTMKPVPVKVEDFVMKSESASENPQVKSLGTDTIVTGDTMKGLSDRLNVEVVEDFSVTNDAKNHLSSQESNPYTCKTAHDSCKEREGDDKKHYDERNVGSNDCDLRSRSVIKENDDDKVESRNDDDDGSESKDTGNNVEDDRTNGEKGGTSVRTKSAGEKEMIGIRSRGEKRSLSLCESSMNVDGKIVVFVRRKKPVCLANNNANMTVLVNNNHEVSINLPVVGNGIVHNSVSKLRTCRRS